MLNNTNSFISLCNYYTKYKSFFQAQHFKQIYVINHVRNLLLKTILSMMNYYQIVQ